VLALFGQQLVDVFTDASETLEDRGNVPTDGANP
jgi:hypothetical protein